MRDSSASVESLVPGITTVSWRSTCCTLAGCGALTHRRVAQTAAAARPRYLTREEVPAEAVETERRVAEQTAKEEGKPEQAITKIVEGRVNAYYKDFVLLEQPSITEPKRTVKQILDDAGLTVDRFARFEVGQA